MVYDTEDQDKIIARALDYGARTDGTPEERARRAAGVISFFVPTFKNSDFVDEHETL